MLSVIGVITNFYEYSLNGENFLLKHSALFYSAENYIGNIKTVGDGEDSYGAEWVKTSELDKIKCTPLVNLLVSRFGPQIGLDQKKILRLQMIKCHVAY